MVNENSIQALERAVAEMSVTPVKAELEYQKNPDLKKEDIVELREWARRQPKLPEITEELLILFHHSCYYKLPETKTCIQVYYETRQETPEFFQNRDVTRPELIHALQVLQYSALPIRDPNGYRVICHGLKQFEASKYVFSDGVKLLLMAIDACVQVEGTVPGYIFLFNMNGVRLTHLLRLSIGLLRKFFVYIQEGMPVRLKAIHVVNTMPIIDKVMFMIKPFMKKELLDMVHFHYGSEYDDLYNYIPKSCLPKDFGGDLESVDELNDKFCDWMLRLRTFFNGDDSVTQTDKTAKSDKHEPSSFKGLTID